jgi:Glycosyltransferase family 9 (heptosyltransferase)
LNLAKYGGLFLRHQLPWIQGVLQPLLRRRDLSIISIFSRTFQYPHWPAPQRLQRLTHQIEEADAVETSISNWGPEVRTLIDAPLSVVGAVLKHCHLFIGVDNGIKHLAWALGIPLIYFMPNIPDPVFILRWLPDFHRMFVFGENVDALTATLEPFSDSE